MSIFNPAFSAQDFIDSVYKDLWSQKEKLLLAQLSDLVSRNILIIEETQPVLVNENDGVKISQAVKLTVKDIEKIKSLEQEVEHLKSQLALCVDILEHIRSCGNWGVSHNTTQENVFIKQAKECLDKLAAMQKEGEKW